MIPQGHKKGVIAYLALCFGLAWASWELAFFLMEGTSIYSPRHVLALLPGACAPAIAALIVRRWITREGFGDAGLRLNLKRWPYYLAALIIPFAVLAAIIVLAPLAGFDPDFTFQRAEAVMNVEVRGQGRSVLMGLFLLPMVSAVFNTLILFGEEFGWRGYLQLRLYPESPLKAALTTGVIWGVWHFPFVWHGRHYTLDNIGAGLICFPIFCVLVSIIFGWVRLKAGSVWAPSLAHAAVNGAGSGTIFLFLGSDGLFWAGFGQPLAWIPLGAVCVAIIATGQMKPAAVREERQHRHAVA